MSSNPPRHGPSAHVTFRDGSRADLALLTCLWTIEDRHRTELERLYGVETRRQVFVRCEDGGFEIHPDGHLTDAERTFLAEHREAARRLLFLVAEDTHLRARPCPTDLPNTSSLHNGCWQVFPTSTPPPVWVSTKEEHDRLGVLLAVPTRHVRIDDASLQIAPAASLSPDDVAYLTAHADALRRRWLWDRVTD
jgi:hypothetical protein